MHIEHSKTNNQKGTWLGDALTPASEPSMFSEAIPLGQRWLEMSEDGLQPASAKLGWTPQGVHVRVEIADAGIVSAATDDNQSLYLLGDTVEVFLQCSGQNEYLELHVSPRNHRTALRWPLGAIEKVRENTGARIEDYRIDAACFKSYVELTATGWIADITIPPQVFGLEAWPSGLEVLFSVSRYDYAEVGGEPILSTIANHRVRNFHLTADWLRVTL
ncbi:MAG TPA: hypothetical protein VF585_04580 [Chthoniobacterales bacterium]|jgi:hypothetical protein